jgi:hypothetical protein
LCPGLAVFFGVFAIGEVAGRFDGDVDAELFPGQSGGIPLFEHPDRSAIDGQ